MTAKKALKSEMETGLDVGIGVTNPSEKLVVNGNVKALGYMGALASEMPDYVFEENYKLKTIEETEAYTKKNKHLPNVPSESEIKKAGNVIDLNKFQLNLLEKIEEAHLYIFKLNKENTQLKEENKELKSRIENIEKTLQKLTGEELPRNNRKP